MHCMSLTLVVYQINFSKTWGLTKENILSIYNFSLTLLILGRYFLIFSKIITSDTQSQTSYLSENLPISV